MSDRRLFIAGATGAVGRTLVPLATKANVSFVAHVRPKSTSKLEGVPTASLELSDGPALDAAMKGCTTVVQLIGTMRKRFSSGDTYESSDIGTTQQLVDAAKRVGTVDHLIILSSVGAGSPIGAYLKAKARAEAIAKESGIAFTMVRPSGFADREGQSMGGLGALTKFLGLVKYQPITLHQLASAMLHIARTRAPLNAALEGQPLWDCVTAAQP